MILTTQDITYVYPGGSTLTFPDIYLERGEKKLVLGQSGCGKTTLLHLMAGLLRPKSGKLKINGKAINQLSSKDLDILRGKEIGIVFQRPHFFKSLNVEENLNLASKVNSTIQIDQDFLKQLVAKLEIDHLLNKKIFHLSEGEKQRVSIVRALVHKPALLLADEPTSALDDTRCQEAIQLLTSAADLSDAGLITVTHDNRIREHFTSTLELVKPAV